MNRNKQRTSQTKRGGIMTRCLSLSPLGVEFDDFLFTSIGEDGKGVPLNMLSALARLDLDPWDEASALAKLPKGLATQRLAAVLAALPSCALAHRDAGDISLRLIALLPLKARPISRLRRSSPTSPTDNPDILSLVTAVVLGYVLCSLFLIAIHQTPVQAEKTPVAAVADLSPLHLAIPAAGR